MTGRCLDEKDERDDDRRRRGIGTGGGNRDELMLPLGMAMEDLYHIKVFRCSAQTSGQAGKVVAPGG